MILSTWNLHSPCNRCFFNLPQGVCGIQIKLPNVDIDFMVNLIRSWNSGQPQTRTVYWFGVEQQRARREKYKKPARQKMSTITLL